MCKSWGRNGICSGEHCHGLSRRDLSRAFVIVVIPKLLLLRAVLYIFPKSLKTTAEMANHPLKLSTGCPPDRTPPPPTSRENASARAMMMCATTTCFIVIIYNTLSLSTIYGQEGALRVYIHNGRCVIGAIIICSRGPGPEIDHADDSATAADGTRSRSSSS